MLQQHPAPPLAAALLEHAKSSRSLIIATSFFSLLFLLSLYFSTSPGPLQPQPDPFLFPTRPTFPSKIPSDPAPPSVAYFISGACGDSARILRLLFASYHPKNQYLLHLDPSAPQTERDRLALTVQSVPIFRAAQNVDVIGKPDYSYSSGSSTISSVLHAASILLKLAKNWDWFINLNADDYPLVTQDGIFLFLFLLSFAFWWHFIYWEKNCINFYWHCYKFTCFTNCWFD